ncbi:hypothetical protein H5410_012651 [Solanum commersonii]|uniref:Uncharacterized protein n=1 Tax=Solanum commersonii TaxID=4109 RepID=A0A9J6ASZ4_SOLCO|nr:hypothetical protein H5410_012651 [Solanum commersonii]
MHSKDHDYLILDVDDEDEDEVIKQKKSEKKKRQNCSLQKQSNCRAITKPIERIAQSFAIARLVQKETQSIKNIEMKFESIKRKFEERMTEQREVKRGTIMVDFHDMPKYANDSRSLKRHCWDRKRF